MVYEYEYTRRDGVTVQVEVSGVPMSKASEPIDVVDDEDGEVYTAHRIISLVADMSYSWGDDVRNSDLPPVKATPEDVKNALEKRKGRKTTYRSKSSVS